MGLFDRTFRFSPSQMLQRDNRLTAGECDVCGATFPYPEYPIACSPRPDKPTAAIDVGGWCAACRRVLCPLHTDYVRCEIENRMWWLAGCADCGEPLWGRAHQQ